MKTYFLGKIDSETLLGVPTIKDHSVFKNPDIKLKAEIATFKIDETEFESGWPAKTYKIIEWDGEEAKCQEGRNISYFSKNK